ncbi:MAG: hypothetical protein Q9219_000625 [cf. Caloplaca sp. 3 TL-2023]
MKFFATIAAVAVLLPIAFAAPAPADSETVDFNDADLVNDNFNETVLYDDELEKRGSSKSSLRITTYKSLNCKGETTIHSSASYNNKYDGAFNSFSTSRDLKPGEVISFYRDDKCQHENTHTAAGYSKKSCINGSARCFKLWRR